MRNSRQEVNTLVHPSILPSACSAHPRGVRALRGALDLPAETEVGDLADELRVDEHVARGQVAVHVAHLGEVLHAGGDATQHSHQLQDLELSVIRLPGRDGLRVR